MNKNNQCYSCGFKGTVPFVNRTFIVSVNHIQSAVTGLNGDECSECKGVVFNKEDNSAYRYSGAYDTAMHQYRKHEGAEMRRIRKKLKLKQVEVVTLFSGAGHNAVSRYEKGENAIPKPLWTLLHLLDRKPELLADIRSFAEIA